jgi:hypothetical protein
LKSEASTPYWGVEAIKRLAVAARDAIGVGENAPRAAQNCVSAIGAGVEVQRHDDRPFEETKAGIRFATTGILTAPGNPHCVVLRVPKILITPFPEILITCR